MKDLEKYVLKTVKYIRDGIVETNEDIIFPHIQTHLYNANRLEKESSILLLWSNDTDKKERILYNLISELSKNLELRIRLYADYWSDFNTSELTFRQKEIFGKILSSEDDWLLKTLKKNSKIRLNNKGNKRYLFGSEDPEMVIKATVSDDEPSICKKAGELEEVGPEVFKSNNDYIAEHRICVDENRTMENFISPKELGKITGRMFKLLHQANIVYGDVFFSLFPRAIHILSDGKRNYLTDYGDSEWGNDTDFDIKMIITSLEIIKAHGSSFLHSAYINTALKTFSKSYGKKFKRE